MHSIDRRRFLQTSGWTALAAWGTGGLPAHAADKQLAGGASTSGWAAEKDPGLRIHTSDPIVLETPLDLLAGEQVTPVSRLFVRNCQPLPPLEAFPTLDDWTVELVGQIDRPRTFTGQMVRSLPRREVEMVVQCSGNGRELFSRAARTEGTQWGRGGMGNVRFAGAKLSSVLDRLGVKIEPGTKYLSAEGRDDPQPGKSDFEHSLPLDEVLEKSLLAYELNGESLPLIHGGPLRLVTPGFYGTMHIKWVSRLRFENEESGHESQIPNYRTPLAPIAPGAKFEPTYANSEPNWRMRLKSVVLSPLPDAKLPAGRAVVEGVAFNDGAARIDSVLVSKDHGASWQRARLIVPASPYAWYRWQAELPLEPGPQEIWARAVDALGRTQPLDGNVFWNPQGYTWNGVDKIQVLVG